MNPSARGLLALFFAAASPLAGQESRSALPAEAKSLLEAASFREAAFERATQALWLADGGLEPLAAAARVAGTPQARRVLVEVLRAQGKLAEALSEAEALHALAPTAATAELCGRLAEACLDLGKAAQHYRAALELAPGLWPEWVLRTRLALLAFGAGDRKGGLEQLHRIANLDREALAASAARLAALQGEHAFAAEFAGPIQSSNRQRTFLSLLQAAHLQQQGERLSEAQATLGKARGLAQSRRERGYVAWAEMEVHAAAGTLERLVEEWLAEPALEAERMLVLVEALASLGRVEQALGLLGRQGSGDPASEEWVSLVLTLALESGFEAAALGVLERRLEADPASLEARLQLSRVLVDLGRMDQAERLWTAALAEERWGDPRRRLQLCRKIREAGFAGLSRSVLADMHTNAEGEWRLWAGVELARLWREAGEPERARELLLAVAEAGEAGPSLLRAVGEALEELGSESHAVSVYRKVLQKSTGEDLELRLAWLLARTGAGLEAIERLNGIWEKTGSASRKRQVESQLLELSAKEGVLGDLADRLEEALEQGRAKAAETALLVNLYAKVGDTDSASDVLALFASQETGDRVEAQRTLAQVYLDAGELREYENTMRRLLEIDPGGASEWWMNLAISALERRAPQDAQEALRELAALGGSDPAFKAGVLAFAGLHQEAVAAYRTALAADPGEVETWLLVGRELAAAGRRDEALALYQFLIDRPGAEDLFVVAVDGLLNLEAPAPILEWAARRVTERAALLPTRLFLYRLLGDLLDTVGRKEPSRRVLEEMVPVAAEQRGAVVRELLEAAIDARDREGIIRWGRRLMMLGELFPPDVYLAVGEALLKDKQWTEAARTFGRARESLDFVALQRRVARIYLENGRAGQALRILRRLIPQAPEDPSLLGELAEVEGLAGDPAAPATWNRTLEMLLARTPSRREAQAAGRPDRYSMGLHESLWEQAAQGLAASADRARLEAVVRRLLARARTEMQELGAGFELDQAPRLRRLMDTLYRLALSSGGSELVREIAADLAGAGGGGGSWVAERVDPLLRNGWGRAVLGLLDTLGPRAEPRQRWRAQFLVEGRPPRAPTPTFDSGLCLALWELIYAGQGPARAALEEAVAKSTLEARLPHGALLGALRLALGDRAGFVGEILALLEGDTGADPAVARARRISVYQVRNLLGRAWALFDDSEKQAVLEALRRLASSPTEQPAWRALYLYGLAAAGSPPARGEDLHELVLEAGIKEGSAEDIARFVPLVPREKRPSVIEAVAREKKGYVLVRFLALAPSALAEELDEACMEVLLRLFREETDARGLISQFARVRSTADGFLAPEKELRLLEALEKRVPGEADLMVARLRCLLALGREQEARELAGRLVANPSSPAPYMRDEAVRRLVEEAAGPDQREKLLAAAREGSEPALLALVRELSSRGEREQAFSLLDAHSSRPFRSAQLFQARHDLMRGLGMHMEAALELIAYVRAAPGLQPHWLLRAATELQGLGRHREAIELIARYNPGGGGGFDHGALQRLRYYVSSPGTAERDAQILADLRRLLQPDARFGLNTLAIHLRQLPSVALASQDREEEPTPFMQAALVPGALEQLEGALTLLSGSVRPVNYTPWELFAAIVWGSRRHDRAGELLARVEALLSAEPAEAQALRLGNMAAAWIPEARRSEWVGRGLALQLSTGSDWISEAHFWADRLERAGQPEAAARLAGLHFLHATLSGQHQARDAIRGLLGLRCIADVPDEHLALALGGFGLSSARRSFGTSRPGGDVALLEEALAAGRHRAVLLLAPELEARLSEEQGFGGERLPLILAAALARAGEHERFLGRFRAFLADSAADAAYLPASLIPLLLPEAPDDLARVAEEAARAMEGAKSRKGAFLERLVALAALRLEAAGHAEQADSLWEKALAASDQGGFEALGLLALEEGRPGRALALLLPRFEQARLHHARAAEVCAALAQAGAALPRLQEGLRAYLSHCPRRDLALEAVRWLPAQEARAALEAALLEHPGDPGLTAALDAL